MPEPMAESRNDRPADTAERAGESGGSAPSGSIMSSTVYRSSTSRMRLGSRWGIKPTSLKDLDGDDDLQRRFNGRREAFEAYKKLKGKAVILDKGFDASLLEHGLISRMVREQNWNNFCTHHEEDSNWEMMREFVANIDPRSHKTWVRGKEIKIDDHSLNTFLGTQDQRGVLTFELINRNIVKESEKDVLRRVAKSMCDRDPLLGERRPTFSEKEIKLEIKPSMDFYFGKIKPILHTHEVSGLSLFGLSEILLGKTLNVGDIISKTLIKKTRGVLSHPNLIRRLCDQAEVNFSEFGEDDKIPIGGPIPLTEWENQEEFKYELIAEPVEGTPQVEPQTKAEHSRAPTPQSRRRAPPGQGRGRGRKRVRVDRGEEQTTKQREIPTQSEPVTAGVNEPASGNPSHSQGTQFTDVFQSLLTLQEQQEATLQNLMASMNEARLREKELELQARREEIEAKREAEERRIKADEERDRRTFEFQMRMIEMLTGRSAGQPSQGTQPSTSTDPTPQPQDPPPPPSSES